jgi:hypothetical protein
VELRKMIRTAIDEAPSRYEIDDVTETVLGRIAKADRGEALRVALRELVRQVSGQTRHLAPATEAAPPKTGRSWKVTAIREQWKRALEESYTVGDGQRARLAELTREELLLNVREREQMAAANLAAAARLQRLADLLAEHSVARVGDLPEDVLRDVLAPEAAA